MNLNQKFDVPLLVLGCSLILLGAIYQHREYLPLEFSQLFFWLPEKQDGYYKVVESGTDFNWGSLFFIVGIAVLFIRKRFTNVEKNDV